jgi:branched-chain amino acid transport system substrate-binding protein
MPLGFKHTLFEVATDVLKRSKALEPQAIREAITATSCESIVGPIQWKQGPVPGGLHHTAGGRTMAGGRGQGPRAAHRHRQGRAEHSGQQQAAGDLVLQASRSRTVAGSAEIRRRHPSRR